MESLIADFSNLLSLLSFFLKKGLKTLGYECIQFKDFLKLSLFSKVLSFLEAPEATRKFNLW